MKRSGHTPSCARRFRRPSPPFGALAIALAAASLAAARPAFATPRVSNDLDGSFWSNTGSWQGNVVPVNGDTVTIGAVATTSPNTPTILFTSTYTGGGLLLLTLNSTVVSTLTFAQSIGAMIANTEVIGDTVSPNTYNQNGGSNTAGTLILGNQTGGNGTYLLSGSGNVTANSLVVGNAGTGTFSQSGGNVTVSSFMGIGSTYVASTSAYTLSGGNLTLAAGAYMTVGNTPHAALTISGGTLNFNNDFFYLDNSSIAGNYANVTLSGTGSIINAGAEVLGSTGSGNALFTQSGGTHTFAAGGLLDVGSAGAATYNLTNGTLSTVGVTVGSNATGTFNQSGGTHTLSSILDIGYYSTGTYTLSGGNLTDAIEIIGDSGTGNFIQIAGNHTNTSGITLGFSAGSTGNYTINGGNLTLGTASVAGSLDIGTGGGGNFLQNAGNVSILGVNGYLGLSAYSTNSGGSGGYTMYGGALSSATIELGSVPNTSSYFSVYGGTVSVTTLSMGTSGSESSYIYLNGNGTTGITAVNETLAFSGNATFFHTLGANNVTGTLTLGAGLSGNGIYVMYGGTLSAYAFVDGAYGAGTFTFRGGAVTIGAGGAVINSLGNAGPASSFTLAGGFLTSPSTPGSFVINPGGSFTQNQTYAATTQSGYINNYGSFTYSAGTFNGTLENDATGTVTLSPGVSFLAGTSILNKGSLTLSANNTMGAGTGTFDNENNITLTGGTLAGSGAILNNGLIFGFGAIAGTGGFTNNGYLSAINGNIVFSTTGPILNAGTIALSPGHQFTLSGSSLFANNGTFSLANGLLNGTSLLLNAAPGSIVGPGTITISFTNYGAISPGAGTLLITTPWTNNGYLQPTGVGSILSGGLITNNASIQGAGTIAAPVTNNGTIEATGGVLNLTGALTNTGTLRVSTGNKILVTNPNPNFPTNAGLIDLAGGTFDNGNQPLTNTGTIAGYGVLSTGGTGLTNNGNITFTGGTATINGNVTNTSTHTLNIKYQPALFTGNVTNNSGATLKTTSTTATFTGTFTNNGSYLSDPAINIFSSLTNAGFMSGSIGDVFTITPGGSFTNSGTFANGGTLNASSNVTNSGTFTQTGPQSWSSTSGLTNTGGTATFGSNAKLASLTITGGTVDTTTSQLIIESTSKSITLAALQADLASGSLTSSTLSSNLALAIIDNASLPTPFTTFGGLPADASSILIAPELLGDANADGIVNTLDLSTVLNHLGQATASWTSGNFDHAATIDLNDLNAVLNHLGATYANSSSVTVAEALTPATPTPEPASLALLSLTLPLLIKRRR